MSRAQRRLLPAALALVLASSTFALALSPDRSLTQYVHDAWAKREGLPVASVTDLAQDLDGYLWLATPAGLMRFDGLRFAVFDASNVEVFDNNVIEALRVGQDGRLWVGGPSGLFVKDGNAFVPILDANGVRLPHVNRIVLDRSGDIWASHASGVVFVRDGVATEYLLPDGESPGRCSGILFATDGSIWFAGNHLLRVREGEVLVRRAELRTEQALTVAETATGEIWVGTLGAGFGPIDATAQFVPVPGSEGLGVFDLEIREDAIWFASFGRGLGRLAEGELTFLGSEEGLASDDVFAVLVDRDGNLWFGTQSGGLSRLREGPFVTISVREGLPHASAASVFQDRDGQIWIGTSGGGLAAFGPGGWSYWGAEQGLGSPAIMAIEQDDRGRIWVGTGNAGAYVLEGNRFRRVLRDGGDPIPAVFALVPGPSGGMRIGGAGGMIWTDGRRFDVLTDAFEGTRWFTTDAVLQGDTLWLGSMASGLMRLAEGEAQVFSRQDGLSADGVIAVHLDGQGDLWLGTYGGGLQRRTGDGWQTFRARDGLCEDVVYSIVEDDLGHLWLGGNLGVCRVERDQVLRFADGENDRIESVLHGRDDGLAAAECSGGPRNSAWKMADGTLWFATPDGVAWVDPALVDVPHAPPSVTIESLSCEGRVIPLREGAAVEALPPGSGGCELRFSAPLADTPQDVTFRYRMEGLDDRWIDGGSSRSATYGRLGPGRYTFSVLAHAPTGEASATPAVLEFRVTPKLYQTAGFKVGAALALALAIFLIHRLRVRRLLAYQQRLEDEVGVRTEELRGMTERLEESNRTLEQRVQDGVEALRRSERLAAYGEMVASVAHEVRHPIFALQAAGFVLVERLRGDPDVASQLRTLELETRRMGTLMEDLLQFARPAELLRAAESIEPVIDEALEVFRAEHPDATLEVRVDVERNLPPLTIDRQRIVQVLINLLANAMRHAGGANRVEIRIDLLDENDREPKTRIRVMDDGAGIDPELVDSIFDPFVTSGQGSGLGLAIVRRIIEDHDGTTRAFNRPEGGACFELLL